MKLPAVLEQDGVYGLQTFYDQINSHIQSLSTTGVANEHYEPMLSSIILEKLPPEIKLLIPRNMNQDIWDLTQMLEIFSQKLKARETCLPSTLFGKNFEFDSKYTDSALYSSTASRGQSPTKSPVKCIFCKGEHWSYKCNIVTDHIARKVFLKNNNLCF